MHCRKRGGLPPACGKGSSSAPIQSFITGRSRQARGPGRSPAAPFKRRQHSVITGLALVDARTNICESDFAETRVWMRALEDELIDVT